MFLELEDILQHFPPPSHRKEGSEMYKKNGGFFIKTFNQLKHFSYHFASMFRFLTNREAEYGATSQGGFEPKISGVVLPDTRASLQSNSGIESTFLDSSLTTFKKSD